MSNEKSYKQALYNSREPLVHDHSKCLELANDLRLARPGTLQARLGSRINRPWNILFYVRKSDDVSEILVLLQEMITYIKEQLGKLPSSQ